MPNRGAAPRDFYEIQESQKSKSLWLFLAVVVFYFLALGFIALAVVLSLGLLLGSGMLASPGFWVRFVLFDPVTYAAYAGALDAL